MNIVAWQTVLTEHQIHTFRELQRIPGNSVVCVLGTRELPERRMQGWVPPDLEGLVVHDLAPANWWSHGKNLLKQYADAVHLFNGLWADRRFLLLLMRAQIAGQRTALLTESYSEASVGYLSEGGIFSNYVRRLVRPLAYRCAGITLSRGMTAVFAISEKAVSQFTRAGFEPDRIFPFGYFVPRQDYLSLPRKAANEPGRLRMVFVGSRLKRKGFDTLLEAMRRCHTRGFNVTLDVYGPPHEGYDRQGIPGIAYRGMIPFGKAQEYICKYDLLVLPSLHDGWGVVVNEALLQGVPVVCTDQVGARILVQSCKAGSVFPVADPEALARKFARIMSSPGQLDTWRRGAETCAPRLEPRTAAEYMHACLGYATGKLPERPTSPWYGPEKALPST